METEEKDQVFKPFQPATDENDGIQSGTPEVEDFDPFEVGASSTRAKAKAIIEAGKKNAPDVKKPASNSPGASRASNALPPRLEVKFKIHEEISSIAAIGTQSEGSSDVTVEGTVLAQVTSSDALKNSPFILVASSSSGAKVGFSPNDTFAKSYASKGEATQVNVISVPKSAVGFVTAGRYKFGERVNHMPMLLERKVTRAKAKIQVAIQVRSKLSNPDDLSDFSIALAMSDKIAGDTVEINAGEGEWDRVTRTIVWKMECLPKGESFMVSVRAKLTEDNAEIDSSELDFPVMMRCKCKDQISSAEFQAIEATGYPATVSASVAQRTYRIIHRLK